MKVRLIILNVILFLILSACSQNLKTPSEITVITMEDNPLDSVNLSEFSSSVEYIALETNPDCYISTISRLKFFGDSIFIISGTTSKKEILVFNKTGDFICKFGQIGQGPGEIDEPRDIIKSGTSFLIRGRKHVVELDKEGNFVRKVFDAPSGGNRLITDNNGVYLLNGTSGMPGLITSYSFDGAILDTIMPRDITSRPSPMNGGELLSVKSAFHIYNMVSDTVWQMEDKEINPKYIFDFGEVMSLQNLLMKTSKMEVPESVDKLNSTPHAMVTRFLENDRFIYLTYQKDKSPANLIISKRSERRINFVKCVNDIDNGMYALPLAFTETQLVFQLQPLKILDHLKIRPSVTQTPFTKLGNSLKEDDNPVLMLVKVKL